MIYILYAVKCKCCSNQMSRKLEINVCSSYAAFDDTGKFVYTSGKLVQTTLKCSIVFVLLLFSFYTLNILCFLFVCCNTHKLILHKKNYHRLTLSTLLIVYFMSEFMYKTNASQMWMWRTTFRKLVVQNKFPIYETFERLGR